MRTAQPAEQLSTQGVSRPRRQRSRSPRIVSRACRKHVQRWIRACIAAAAAAGCEGPSSFPGSTRTPADTELRQRGVRRGKSRLAVNATGVRRMSDEWAQRRGPAGVRRAAIRVRVRTAGSVVPGHGAAEEVQKLAHGVRLKIREARRLRVHNKRAQQEERSVRQWAGESRGHRHSMRPQR